jgi:molybdopterin synthase catalytic subunit
MSVHVSLTAQPLALERLAELIEMVRRSSTGAIATFQGTTRDVDALEYEAYVEMAEERLQRIAADAVEGHGLEAAAVEHRVGIVARGESSVLVVVSAAHREEAFAGAREIIDRIKSEAPIWKKEVDAGVQRWVEGRPAGGEASRAGS